MFPTQHLFEDSLSGRKKKCLYHLGFKTFLTERVKEIAALAHSIENPSKTQLVFQRLPRHMRRRSMGHNNRRMPRILQEAHKMMLQQSGLPSTKKRPSRRYRRHARNLLAEYNRRQKTNIWLETHIWHAKRFHMVEKWGYKLAHFPNNKSGRACYRATANHCLIQDVSFLACVELNGPERILLDGLSKLTHPECGLTFGAKLYLAGTREGNVMIYHHDSYPYNAIGEVSFLWKYVSPPDKSEKWEKVGELELRNRSLWIWIHPSYYQEVIDELKLVFILKAEETAAESGHSTEATEVKHLLKTQKSGSIKKKKVVKVNGRKNVDKQKLELRNLPFVKTPKYSNGSVHMTLLKDTLNRFKLTGPLSLAVIYDCLKIADVGIPGSHTGKESVGKGDSTSDIESDLVDEFEQGSHSPKTDTEEKNEEIKGSAFNSVPEMSGSVECRSVKRDAEGNIKNKAGSKDKQNSNSKEDETPFAKRPCPNIKWWKRYYSSVANVQMWKWQKQIWECLSGAQSPAQLQPHSVIGLTVRDPRLMLLQKRTKVLPDVDESWEPDHEPVKIQPHISSCAIWDPVIRDEATMDHISDNELNSRRSRNLVPGTPVELGNKESRIPVLLIQNPGSQDPQKKRLGYGSGWDLILPAGWSMAFWVALYYRGARAGGLREDERLKYEEGVMSCPQGFPDTRAGQVESEMKRKALTEKHFRHPPDKRVNYIKLGMQTPFHCPWKILICDWINDCALRWKPAVHMKPDETRFYILRNKSQLQVLRTALKRQNGTQINEISGADTIGTLCKDKMCLVAVTVHALGKGSPGEFSTISLPTKEDLQKYSSSSSFSPVEPVHEDNNQVARKELKKVHKKRKVTIKRKKRKEKEKLEKQIQTEGCVSGGSLQTVCKPQDSMSIAGDQSQENELYKRKLENLWLPEVKTVKDSCAREILGYSCAMDFCFSEGHGVCLAYCTLLGLLQLLDTKMWNPQTLILLRNSNSHQYYFGKINIL